MHNCCDVRAEEFAREFFKNTNVITASVNSSLVLQSKSAFEQATLVVE